MLFSLHFPNTYLPCVCRLPLDVAPGFELASSERFVGAHSSRCPATMSWNCALRGSTQHARAACTRCHEWIPPWWWFMTLPRATAVPAVAREGSTPCPLGREAISRLATRRSLDATVEVRKRKMEGLQALSLRSSLEGCFHRLTHRHLHVRNVFKCIVRCTYKWCTGVCLI